MLTHNGATKFAQELLSGESQATLYIGLFDQELDQLDASTTAITTEPTSAGGYARIALTRSYADWPTQETVDGQVKTQTKLLTFSAAGADFSRAYSRMFLCDAPSGNGNLYGFSGAIAAARLLLDGEAEEMYFALFL